MNLSHGQSLNALHPDWWQVSSVSIVKLDLKLIQIKELSRLVVALNKKHIIKVTYLCDRFLGRFSLCIRNDKHR